MTDNQLFALIGTVMSAGLTAQGVTVGIRQSNQPTLQGTPSIPFLFVQKISDHRYGFLAKSYSTVSGITTLTETQPYITAFQVEALVPLANPSNTTSLSAADYVNAAALAMQSSAAIGLLEQNTVRVLRITDIRQTFFRDEKGLNEASPSFNFSLVHSQVLQTVVPTVSVYNPIFDIVN